MPIAPNTKTVQNVMDMVRREFGDDSGIQLSTADFYRWINLGQLEISRKREAIKQIATTPIISGQNNYTFPSSNVISIKSMLYDDRPLEHISFEDYQEQYLKFASAQMFDPQIPTVWYEWDDQIYLYPTPTDSTVNITAYLIVEPTPVTASTDVIDIPNVYFDALVSYVLQRAYALDDDDAGSQIEAQKFDSKLADVSTNVISTKFYTMITILEDDL